MTRRDIIVAISASAFTACIALAFQQKAVIGSSIYDWNSIPADKTNVGEVRSFFRGPTATLDELEVHVTTLNPGQASHPPHKHPNEELVIVKEGTVECLVNGEWKRVGAGSVIFNASNQLHGIRNVGAGPATYHVINWRSPGAPAGQPQP
jgi:XRE family transcriptional regulator, regulator of sulfur utilization